MGLQNDVRDFIQQLDVLLPADFSDDSPLITSGLLSSLALFDLAVWIEEQCGASIVAESVDMPREWDTVASITAFIDQAQNGGAPGRSA